MRFVSLVSNLVGKARRGLSQGLSIGTDVDGKTSPGQLAEQLRQVMLRVNRLEAVAPPEPTEFEVAVSTAGALVSLRHSFGVPVRWWVTSWGTTTAGTPPVATHALVMDATSDSDTLVLRSYVAGRAVVRIEPSTQMIENA